MLALITTVLALHHHIAPAQSHISKPLAEVSQNNLLKLPVESDWRLATETPLVGCLNGHSLSGDNTHLVLTEPVDNVRKAISSDLPQLEILQPASSGVWSDACRIVTVPPITPQEPLASKGAVRAPSVDRELRESCCAAIDAVLGHECGIRDAQSTPLGDLGMKSKQVIPLTQSLANILGITLFPTTLFDYPTLNALLEHSTQLQQKSASSSRESTQMPLPHNTQSKGPVAITGVSCLIPGGASTFQNLVSILAEGVDGVVPIPESRMEVADWSMAAQTVGGFVMDGSLKAFDCSYFTVSVSEAHWTDPAQRLVLEQSCKAMQRAGESQSRMSGSSTAVYVGASHHDWERLLVARQKSNSPYASTGISASVLAGRVSYEFGLVGPSIVVDTACSASGVAMSLGYDCVSAGSCSHALIAGVNLLLEPTMTNMYAETQMLSAEGRCKTFDRTANGYVRSEGCVAVMLQLDSSSAWTLSGAAINQDGERNTLRLSN